jgi:two-component system nitrate/nitrite response regulator NarL
MRDLFICPRNSLLANWSDACPSAQIYAALAAVRLPKKEPYIFWLHADINSQQWIVASIAQVFRDYFNPKIVVLANVPSQAEALLALGQGAAGYCHAYSPAEVLVEVKTVITHGGIWLGRDLLQHMIMASTALVGTSTQQVSEILALLTQREQEVALEAACGLSNKEIAKKLDITERTVKAHLSATFERLGIRDRLQLALMLNDHSVRPTH